MQPSSEGPRPAPDRTGALSSGIYLWASAGYFASGLWLLFVGYPWVALEQAVWASVFLGLRALEIQGRRAAVAIVALAAALVSCSRADWLFGWESGGHYYILAAIVLVLGAESLAPVLKFAAAAAAAAAAVALWSLAGGQAGTLALPRPWDSSLGEVNLLGAFGLLALSFCRYTGAVLAAERRLEESCARIRDIANTDALTGICNRRYADELLRIALRIDIDRPPIVGMIDIDDFKSINDTYGHECGDEALKAVCMRLQGGLRKGDILGRWGGEEFLVIIRDAAPAQGLETMERLRRLIADAPIETGGRILALTVTIGMAVGDPALSVEAMVAEADRRLYEGKRGGKNRVVAIAPGVPLAVGA